jgi:YVTN family beta-propeller protein
MFNSSQTIISFGVQMSFQRVGQMAAMVVWIVLWAACGQVYRPVVIPCSVGGLPNCPVETPPAPSSFHAVFGISQNAASYPGGAMQIDVGGDSIIGETPSSDASAPNIGNVPTYAAIVPNDSRVFITSAGSLQTGGVDVVSSFTPAIQASTGTGLGPVTTTTLPSLPGQSATITALSEAGNVVTATLANPLVVSPSGTTLVSPGRDVVISGEITAGYNGTFPIVAITPTTLTYNDAATGLAPCSPCTIGGAAAIPPQPVFANATQNSTIYLANFNSNSVSAFNGNTNSVTNSANVGTNPVALAQLPNGLKLYVANQGSNSVSSLNTSGSNIDLSTNVVTGFTGVTPVWVVARSDSQKVYVLTQGDGQLVTIDTATDTVTSSLAVGAGANYIFYDPNLNRLYVTNPTTNTAYVFAVSGGAKDTPALLQTISFPLTSAPCNAGCSAVLPISVTALADETRFYVAGYQTAAACPDTLAGTNSACVVPSLWAFDANNFALETTLTLLTDPPFAADVNSGKYQYAVPPNPSCVPPAAPALYSPGTTRFRVFTTASVDSTRVYMSICDAGVIAVINTSDNNANDPSSGGVPADTVITDLPAPFGTCTLASCSGAVKVTAFSITSNIVTFHAVNNFTAGERVLISGLQNGTSLNGIPFTVLATGLSGSQFECYFTNPNVGLTADSGTGTVEPPSQAPILLLPGQ